MEDLHEVPYDMVIKIQLEWNQMEGCMEYLIESLNVWDKDGCRVSYQGLEIIQDSYQECDSLISILCDHDFDT